MTRVHRVVVSIMSGMVAFLALFPAGRQEGNRSFSIMGYPVPSENVLLAILVGVLAAVTVWFLTSRRPKR